jgi:uncharacterized protein with PIN domain
MSADCPECGNKLRERGPNFLRNIRRREVEDVHDRFVCPSCETTFSKDAIFDEDEVNIVMKQLMEETENE